MEKELTKLFEVVKKAAEVAEQSPSEEDRCLDALDELKKFPVNYQVLVSTQVGKRLRQLTKHRCNKIKTLASDVVEIWKNIIVQETVKNKKNGNSNSNDSEPATANSVKIEQGSKAENVKVEKVTKSETPPPVKKVDIHAEKNSIKVEKQVKEKHQSTSAAQKPAAGPPKLTSLVYCKDSVRDKVRELLSEALCKVYNEVGDDLQDEVNACDAYRVAVLVETAMFEKWGKSNGAQKFKYRSIMFNIKDPNNPDFRRKVLLGEIQPHAILTLTPEEMASNARKMENEQIKQKAMFECQRGGPPQASTDQFTCGRCKQKKTTYYQLQTRSADEPMTTFITCVNCENRWKIN